MVFLVRRLDANGELGCNRSIRRVNVHPWAREWHKRRSCEGRYVHHTPQVIFDPILERLSFSDPLHFLYQTSRSVLFTPPPLRHEPHAQKSCLSPGEHPGPIIQTLHRSRPGRTFWRRGDSPVC